MGIKPIQSQSTGRIVAALPDLTIDPDRLIGVQFMQAIAQLSQRNIDCAFDVPGFKLIHVADIQQQAVIQICELLPVNQRCIAP